MSLMVTTDIQMTEYERRVYAFMLETRLRAKTKKYRAKTPNYWTAHDRIESVRGPARNHPCLQCGDTNSRNMTWAYSHLDPHEYTRDGRVFSMDPSFYIPLCRPCHTKLDDEQRGYHTGNGKPNQLLTECRTCGTPFDEENTYVSPQGRQRCRACLRRNEKKRKLRKRNRS